MGNIAIVTDSTSDLPLELIKKYKDSPAIGVVAGSHPGIGGPGITYHV